MNTALAARHYQKFMEAVGIPESVHSKGTPERVARLFQEYTEGLRECPFKFTVFPRRKGYTYDQLVIEKDIPFTSTCAHHHVFFSGTCAVGYLPSTHIVGLSKIVRAVNWIAHKPSIQEELTEEIADFLESKLNPRALFVLMEAQHSCITSRGVTKPGVINITHCMRGKSAGELKNEFLTLIGRR